MMDIIRRWKRLITGGALLLAVLIIISEMLVYGAAAGQVYAEGDLNRIPECSTALVLGCRPGGRYYLQRIEAATELYNSGKVRYVLVSGDNSRVNYNESSRMARDLQARGVPQESIYCDYAGFRTLDSVVRAKEIFCQDHLIIVSQEFHLLRALYLAQNNGIEAVGYCADFPKIDWASRTRNFIRERLARVKAVADVLLCVKPHFMGDKIEIGTVAQKPLPEVPDGRK